MKSEHYWVAALLAVTSRFPLEKRTDNHLGAFSQGCVQLGGDDVWMFVSYSADSELLMNHPKYLFLTGQPMQWKVQGGGESESSGFKSWLYPVPAV